MLRLVSKIRKKHIRTLDPRELGSEVTEERH